ncbi:MAG TPA: formate dehydrogenase accessory sulfurtransferase FdhD [Syntrophales bacterium]|nr:formate dehydrogenase accessory sulfurtransferase FdhD [Syntrophales bacterium]HOX93278.1 formate dehydrogenase accessory sulfurtransferase FdhD [Syntrophales bacterium]HPI56248.1 formate dehydrogenase accessory sulfurtransferase FdhD [Syntrophales bacterium]HPN24435.1 formate dehydrogenase accessory sulfurtransferase FdhD [Syntrophales bacterium]HQM29065.1 formate dehydrogenase accessory sulfurtransferase FdhD [Syntrophales bacterium]
MKKKPSGPVEKVRMVLCDTKEASRTSAAVIRERMVEIVLNGRRVVSVACTGEHLEELAAGFLRSEGVVKDRRDILALDVTADGGRVEVRVAAGKGRRVLGKKAGRTLASSGARGVVAYDDAGTGLKRKANGGPALTPRNVLRLMNGLLRSGELHDATRGTHCSALATPQKIIVAREDIGRHNTLDMLSGYALLKELSPKDKVILTTGRVSAEIIHKIRTMCVSLIISHSAPTSRAVALAEEFGITLIGYVRNGKMRIYAHPERIRF